VGEAGEPFAGRAIVSGTLIVAADSDIRKRLPSNPGLAGLKKATT
jgi:hypothetical protein